MLFSELEIFKWVAGAHERGRLPVIEVGQWLHEQMLRFVDKQLSHKQRYYARSEDSQVELECGLVQLSYIFVGAHLKSFIKCLVSGHFSVKFYVVDYDVIYIID